MVGVSKTRGQKFKVRGRRFKGNLRGIFCQQRVVSIWSKLPGRCWRQEEVLKRNLDRYVNKSARNGTNAGKWD